MTADRQTACWEWEEKQNKLYQKHILKQLQRLSGLAWCDINTHQIRIPWALLFSRHQNILKISCFSARTTRKNNFILPVAPQGTVFRSGISVNILNFLYVCSVFRSYLVLFIFHSDDTFVFLFLLFSFVFSFPFC